MIKTYYIGKKMSTMQNGSKMYCTVRKYYSSLPWNPLNLLHEARTRIMKTKYDACMQIGKSITSIRLNI